MKTIEWTKEEETVLLENYKIIGIIKCAELLNKSKSVIFRKYQELTGLIKRDEVEWTDEMINVLKENYPILGSFQCAKLLNINKFQIEIKVGKLNLTRDFNNAPEGYRVCGICKKTKENNEFAWHVHHKNKLKYKCKECSSVYDRAYKDKRFTDDVYKLERAKKQLLYGSKWRAKKKGLEFDLDIQWIEDNLKELCPVLNKKYNIANGKSKLSYLSPSIDRIDNNKGYTKDNCIIVCLKVNTTKNSCTWQEIEKVANFYKQLEITKNKQDYEI